MRGILGYKFFEINDKNGSVQFLDALYNSIDLHIVFDIVIEFLYYFFESILV
jgi:hypothetical protein